LLNHTFGEWQSLVDICGLSSDVSTHVSNEKLVVIYVILGCFGGCMDQSSLVCPPLIKLVDPLDLKLGWIDKIRVVLIIRNYTVLVIYYNVDGLIGFGKSFTFL
jgi:uncharacterized protein (DUF779 family)